MPRFARDDMLFALPSQVDNLWSEVKVINQLIEIGQTPTIIPSRRGRFFDFMEH
jgi:hypothetical protein